MKDSNLVSIQEAEALLNKSQSCAVWPQEWEEHGLPVPISEYKFHPTRKWRIDFFFKDVGLAIELEGIGTTKQGRHQRIGGFKKDIEKYNAIAEAGYTLLRYCANRRKIDFAQIKRVYDRLTTKQ
jgi:hypothetical protein